MPTGAAEQPARPIHPLAYVAVELQVPFSPRLVAEETIDKLVAQLGSLPVVRSEERQQLTLGAGAVQVRSNVKALRLSDLASTQSLILTPTSLVFETTRYPGFESFSSKVDEILRAIEQICPPVGFDRLGLRYVNEVRPTRGHSVFHDWASAISPIYISALVGAEDALRSVVHPENEGSSGTSANRGLSEQGASACRLVNTETTMQFELQDNIGITIKLANLEGSGIVGNEPLKRYQVPDPGPFFVVDFDGFWPATGTHIQSFSRPGIIELLGGLHTPVKATFNWASTSEYRDEAGVVNQS